MIKAQIVADSLSPQGDRLVSTLCTFPRIILAEVNTHRMLSKNTSSSRAIPFFKMLESIRKNPFTPIAWQTHHKGMQGSEYVSSTSPITIDQFAEDFILLVRKQAEEDKFIIDKEFENVLYHLKVQFNTIFEGETHITIKSLWETTRDIVILCATMLYTYGKVSKQICNRLLEPFMWTTMLITGPLEGGWNNFFNLRCPSYKLHEGDDHKTYKSWKDAVVDYPAAENADILTRLSCNKGAAEIHMMALAECIWDAFNESTPLYRTETDWHIPFEDIIDNPNSINKLKEATWYWMNKDGKSAYINLEDALETDPTLINSTKIMISVAMAARTSYTIVGEEKAIDWKNLVDLHDRLIAQNPPHSSPMEHVGKAMSNQDYMSNIKGIINYDKDGNFKGTYNELLKIAGWCRNFKGFIPYRHIIETNI